MVTNWRDIILADGSPNAPLIRALDEAYSSRGPGQWSLASGVQGVGTRAGNPITGAQLVDFEMTALLLRTAPYTGVDVGTELFPVANVDKWRFKLGKVEGLALFPGQISRPPGSPYLRTRPQVDGNVYEAKRYGRAGWVDVDELQNQSAAFPALSLLATRQAQEETLRGLDAMTAETVSDNASYAGHAVGGDWTNDGTMLEQVNDAAEVLTQSTNLPKSEFTLVLFNTVLQVAQRDALFLERRSRSNVGAVDPTVEDIRAYLGVKAVKTINAVGKAAEAAAAQYIFPSDAILYYQGEPTQLATAPPEFGIRCWGRTFRVPGVASVPWFERDTTSWIYPYDIRQLQTVLDPGCAYRIVSPQ